MHRTLKVEATRPAELDCVAQQRRLDEFRAIFNHERPHEALGQKTPASLYTCSPRPFPDQLPALEYPRQFEVRRVSRNGGFRWNSDRVHVSHALADQHIGLEPVDDGVWTPCFGPLRLGRFHERERRIEISAGTKRRRRA